MKRGVRDDTTNQQGRPVSPLWHVYVRGLEPLLELLLLVGSRILSLIRSGIPLVPRNEGRGDQDLPLLFDFRRGPEGLDHKDL